MAHIINIIKFRYFDDPQVIELIMLSGVLKDYDYWSHVPNDIAVDQQFLPSSSYKMQSHLNKIQTWSTENKVKINEKKSNFMIFTRCQTDFTSRLLLNNNNLEQVNIIRLLGLWITDNMSWQMNCEELCKKAYSRVSMLTKLKYVGTKRNDLLDVYKLFIRSVMEYCSVVYHSMLTNDQANMLERVQKVCLKVILGTDYINYSNSLEEFSLLSLYDRREKRILDFSHKALSHPLHKNMFPIQKQDLHDIRNKEKYVVNFANTETYKNSFIPYAQQKLNKEHMKKHKS